MIVWLAVLPMVAALAVAPFRRTRHIAAPMAAAALVLMALLAVTLGDAGPVIALGRVLRLLPGERATLAIVWVLVAVTILCTYRIPQQSLLYPLALAAVGMLTAAAMTRHLAIAALLLELGAILTVMLIPARVAGAASVSVRLLVLFAVAGACVLLASWTQDARAAGLEGDALLSMGAICLTLGGGILLAAGPLGLWLPSVFQFDNPLASVMLGAALPTTALICLTDALASLRPPGVPGFWSDLLLAGGVLACLIGGLGATMQASLRRIAGYAAVADMGIVFMALGLNPMGEMDISAG
ncbi:MAG: hypothetical protein FJZ90_15225, partial [Chloroflexi bacterium]|nr:hypothetical protein [Chloroflexota bacterium]